MKHLIKGTITGAAAVVEVLKDGSMIVSEWLSADEQEAMLADNTLIADCECDYEFAPADIAHMAVIASV